MQNNVKKKKKNRGTSTYFCFCLSEDLKKKFFFTFRLVLKAYLNGTETFVKEQQCPGIEMNDINVIHTMVCLS